MSFPFRYLFENPDMSPEEWQAICCEGSIVKYIVHEQFKTGCTEEEATRKLHSLWPDFFLQYAPRWAKAAVVAPWAMDGTTPPAAEAPEPSVPDQGP